MKTKLIITTIFILTFLLQFMSCKESEHQIEIDNSKLKLDRFDRKVASISTKKVTIKKFEINFKALTKNNNYFELIEERNFIFRFRKHNNRPIISPSEVNGVNSDSSYPSNLELDYSFEYNFTYSANQKHEFAIKLCYFARPELPNRKGFTLENSNDKIKRKNNLWDVYERLEKSQIKRDTSFQLTTYNEGMSMDFNYCVNFNFIHLDSMIVVEYESDTTQLNDFKFYEIIEGGDIMDTIILQK